MAASSIPDVTFLEDLSDNFLQCPVHLDRFDKPKMLPCLHSICLSCLDQWQKQMNAIEQVTCPQCRRVCPVPPDGIQGLPDNFLINSLLDYVDQHGDSSDDKKCDICGNEEAMSNLSRCVDCSMFLCSVCTASHKKIPSTANHQLIPMTEFDDLSVEDRLNLSSPMCAKHPTSRLEFFCLKCKTPVCTQCTVVAHKAPAHKIQELPEAFSKLKKQLESELKGTYKINTKVQQAIANTTTSISELDTQRDEAYETAQQQADKIIDLISQYLAEIEETIDHEYQEQKMVMDKRLEDLLQMDDDFKHTQEFGNRILQFGNQVTLTSVGPDIVRKVADLKTTSRKLVVLKSKPNLNFQINDEFESEMCCDSIGYITKDEDTAEESETAVEVADDLNTTTPSTEEAPDIMETRNASAAQIVLNRTYKGRSYPGNALNLYLLARGNPVKVDDITGFRCQMKMPVVNQEDQKMLDKLDQSPATSSFEKIPDTGSLFVCFVPKVPGNFTLFITLNGKPIKSYPYTIQVFPAMRREFSRDQTDSFNDMVEELVKMNINTIRSNEARGRCGFGIQGQFLGRGRSPGDSQDNTIRSNEARGRCGFGIQGQFLGRGRSPGDSQDYEKGRDGSRGGRGAGRRCGSARGGRGGSRSGGPSQDKSKESGESGKSTDSGRGEGGSKDGRGGGRGRKGGRGKKGGGGEN